MDQANFRPICQASDIPPGKMRGFSIEGREILICHTVDGWHALDDVCTHAYAKISEGRLRGVRLICPLHGASFDCRTGAVLGAPAISPLKLHQIRCVDGQIEVAIGA